MAKVKKISDSYTAYAKGGVKIKRAQAGISKTSKPAFRKMSRDFMMNEQGDTLRGKKAAEAYDLDMEMRRNLQKEKDARMKKGLKFKNGGITKKAKSGASFPDLNKDGKITKADILKGRGVIKNGGKMKKARGGATLSPSKSSVSKGLGSSKRLKSGGTLSPSKKAVSKRLASAHTRIAKKGASMKKCRGGCY